MPNVKEITRESWILATFPEWGTWLNEEIEEEVVPEGNFAMWWLGNCGTWIKTPAGANVVMDLWSNRGKSTKKVKDMVRGHQMANMAGVRKLQPNLRVQPMVIDPFAINELDYYLVSHFHSDHIDPYTAAAILNNPKLEHVKFIGPYHCGRIWEGWGVPKERIIVVKPGGTIYHGADSHFSNYFAKHGKDFKIDVALNNYGENPVGIQDKMTSIDLLRMAENLRTKVIIPVHYDIWSNFMASTNEILELWKMRKDRLQYDFHPFIWEVGGKYTYPQDQHLVEYHHPRGFDDCFEQDSNIQFKALL
ncbi:TPA: L-ascorbate 6-phosphate lactonase [Streptococcus pneumoniae]